MSPKRADTYRKPDLPIWKCEKRTAPKGSDAIWFVEADDLRAAIGTSPNSDEVIRKKMGRGYHHLERALEGERLTMYEVSHIEYGIT
ncbi:MAG TPA: hypothetical protein VF412_05200 [Bdellovibrio sp.]|uniref:hypothetical protein n=1 Tax=Bdellovibrio sp. TaxID=28201 RepID=UPI002F047F81